MSAVEQLAFTFPAEPEWFVGWRPDYEAQPGAQYVIMIRDPENDPPRRSREERQALGLGYASMVRERRALDKTAPADWYDRIFAVLREHGPQTFNALGVRLLDWTADLLGGTAVETAVWDLVERGDVAATMEAPIRFRDVCAPRCAEQGGLWGGG